MILLASALAATPQAGLLICADAGACAADRAFVESIDGAGPGGFTVLDFNGAFAPGAVPDGLAELTRFRLGLADLKRAVEERRWSAAVAASQTALDALRGWKGPVLQQELFDLHFLRGVAELNVGRSQGQVYDFRQAAAIADGVPFPLPDLGEAVARAWLDEQRKMVVSSRGALALGEAPPGTRWFVDGREVEAGVIPLFPGNHRVTARAPGAIRSWTVEVPVLAERTSSVTPVFGEGDDPAWVLQQLDQAVATLDAADSVKSLLVAWCADMGVDEVRLMRVDVVHEAPATSVVVMTDVPLERPAAAAGEVHDLGDGVPTTFEGEVMSRHAEHNEGHTTETNRLRIVYFDAQTRRFSTDSTLARPLQAPPERVRLGLRAAWTGMMDRVHLGGDLVVFAPVGPISLEGRLGVLRADADYNFYRDWVDPTLYHGAFGARWAPAWSVAPYAALAVDVYVPVAIGARAEGGVQVEVGKAFRLEAGGAAGWLTTGPAFSAGLGLSRGF